jgi:MscS family membrane protein
MAFLGIPVKSWQELGLALLILAAGVLLGRLLLLILERVLRPTSQRTHTRFDDALLRALRVPIFWLMVVVALQIALAQLSFLPESWANNRDDLMFVLYVLLGYLTLHRLADNLMRWYAKRMAERTDSRAGEEVVPFVRRVSLIVLGAIALIVVLSHLGVDVSALVTTLGIGSLAIALAAQATLADMISGFAIIADNPFSIGDRIEILELDTWGDVMDIGLRSTRIRTRDNRMVIVPNSVIGRSLVVNHSVPSTVYRVETRVGVAYGSDIDQVRRIMIEAVRAQPWVMQNEPIEALFLEYGESALFFRARCWIEHYVETRRIMDKLNSCLYKALNDAGIEMPRPERLLYHRVASKDREGLVSVLREAQPASGGMPKES